MLIRFKVSNFLSFDNMQEISMISGKTRIKEEHVQDSGDVKLLKFSALFGANASGKSSLLKAINFAQSIILRGLQFSSNMYCKISSGNKEKITTFDFEIKLDNKYYSYGFDVLLLNNSIKAEWLYELKANGEERKIFVREINQEIYLNQEYFTDATALDRLKIYAMDIQTQDNVLFLTVMNKNKNNLYQDQENNIVIFKKIYEWFEQVLVVIPPEGKMIDDSYYASEENLEKITEIVSKFGTGISRCKIEPIKQEELATRIPPQILSDVIKFTEQNYMNASKQGMKKVKANSFLRVNNELYIFEKSELESIEIKTIKFEHMNNDGEYSFSEESDGTRRILDLIEILLNNKTNKVYFIDELDRCLHPQLTYKFIEEFLKNKERNNIQLIVTTHESRLLNFELLRRDEIWFANREKNGPTQLYSLEDYNERFDKKIDKAYLDGRYGGVPIFETLYPIGADEECENQAD